MKLEITPGMLEFLDEAKKAFSEDDYLKTYRNEQDTMIALRRELDPDFDNIEIYMLGDIVANFVEQLRPINKPRKAVMDFARDMEEQLKVNEHKGGWREEHWCDLAMSLQINSENLRSELMKKGTNQFDSYEVAIRAANIANYAMMISDNEVGGFL